MLWKTSVQDDIVCQNKSNIWRVQDIELVRTILIPLASIDFKLSNKKLWTSRYLLPLPEHTTHFHYVRGQIVIKDVNIHNSKPNSLHMLLSIAVAYVENLRANNITDIWPNIDSKSMNVYLDVVVKLTWFFANKILTIIFKPY